MSTEGIERFGHRVLAFCQLTNHVHMAIQVGDVPLSRIMQNLSFRYTRWVNWRWERCGHLFHGRYKAVLVDADTHLLELTAYIHLNPVCKPSLEAVIEAVTKIYGLREEDLRSSGQKRQPSEARSIAAWAVRELTDATLNDLAGKLARDASILSAAIRRVEVRVKNEPDLAEKLNTLKVELGVSIFQA